MLTLAEKLLVMSRPKLDPAVLRGQINAMRLAYAGRGGACLPVVTEASVGDFQAFIAGSGYREPA